MIRLMSFLGVGVAALLLFSSCTTSPAVRPSDARTHPTETAEPRATSNKSSQSKNSSKKAKVTTAKSSQKSSKKSSGITASQIRKRAKPYLGVRYRWGGTTKKGFDCSGFMWKMFQDMGYTSFKRTSSSQMYLQGKSVRRNSIKAGDLVFFNTSGSGISHVGMVVNSTTFVHASTSKGITYTEFSNTYWKPKVVGFRRYY